MLRRLVVVLHWPAFLWSLFLIGGLIFGVMLGEDIGEFRGLFWFFLPTFFYYSAIRYVLLNEWVWFPWSRRR